MASFYLTPCFLPPFHVEDPANGGGEGDARKRGLQSLFPAQ